MLEKIVDTCVALLSWPVRWVNINRVWNDQSKIYKRRKWWAWAPLLVGNGVLMCRQVPVRVLSTTQWLVWEREVKRVLNGENVPAGGMLICNRLDGLPLADWLANSNHPPSIRLNVLKNAFEALQALHHHQVSDGRGDRVYLSHGDATLTNVLYHEVDQEFQWIDFDLRHPLYVPAPQRHADDLRAFLFSAAKLISPQELAGLFSAAQTRYQNSAVWGCLRDQLNSCYFRFDIFHAAQIRRGPQRKNSSRQLADQFSLLRRLICR